MESEEKIYTKQDLLILMDLTETPTVLLDDEGKLIASNRFASIDSNIRTLIEEKHQKISLSNNHEVVTQNHPLNFQNEVSSILLSNITHELRTPLNSIQGMTKLSREICIQPELQEYLGHIEQSVQTLSDFVYVLIEYMTIMNGNLVLNPRVTDIEEFLIDTSRIHILKAQEKGLQFGIFVSPHIPEKIWIDSSRLHLVCDQLIGNGIKFSDQGTVWLRVTYEQEHLIISISDQGVGISEEFVHRVFNPFEQEVFQYTRKQGGSGIGLTIVKKLVEAMDGTIEIESKKNMGTRVKISIPLVESSQEALGSHYRNSITSWTLVTTNTVIETIFRDYAEHFSFTIQIAKSITEIEHLTHGAMESLIFIDDCSIPALEIQQLHLKFPQAIRLQGFHQAQITTVPLQGLRRLVYPFTPKTLGKLFEKNSRIWNKTMIQSKDMFSGQRILIVEDDAINLLSVVRFFTSRGAIVYQAKHVKSALELLMQYPIDIALVDIGLPEISGFELLRMIREGEIGTIPNSLSVIALTAYSSQEDRMRMKTAGFTEIIHKPYEPETLAKQVYNLLHEVNNVNDVKFKEKIESYLKLEQYSKIERTINQKKQDLTYLSGELEPKKSEIESLLLKCLIAARSEQKDKVLELLNHELLKDL